MICLWKGHASFSTCIQVTISFSLNIVENMIEIALAISFYLHLNKYCDWILVTEATLLKSFFFAAAGLHCQSSINLL